MTILDWFFGLFPVLDPQQLFEASAGFFTNDPTWKQKYADFYRTLIKLSVFSAVILILIGMGVMYGLVSLIRRFSGRQC